MKLNLNYYSEEKDKKQISEEYEEVLERVVSCTTDDFSKTLDSHAKIKNILALSDIRQNILNWYSFKCDATILELNANYGEVTGLLCNRAKRVVSIEQSKKYADIICKRHEDKENLELIVGNFLQIDLQEKFDYIVIVGIVESLKETIQYANKYLKEDGTILLAVNNKFGVRAWITTKEDEKVVSNNKTAISKEQLEKILEGKHYKYYYPLPNYKLPNIIYTESCMPTVSNIYRDLTYKDESVNFKELEAYYEIVRDNPENFRIFANSFLVEISNKEIPENNIKFIAYSNIRKDEYRIKTIVEDKEVYKTKVNEKADKHIQKVKKNVDLMNELGICTLDSYTGDVIVSRRVNAETLEEQLIRIFKEQGKEKFLEKIGQYREFLKQKLQLITEIDKNIFTKYKVKNDEIEKLTFVKHGLWDLIFQNCFVVDNEYYFYDQEWYEENTPIEYILYRAILYFHESKQYITDEEIFEYLGIQEFISVFKELDDKIQEKIRKPLVWNIHTKDELDKSKYSKLKKKLEEKEIEIQSLKSELDVLKQEDAQKHNALVAIENSLSWKVTKPLRGVKKLISGK